MTDKERITALQVMARDLISELESSRLDAYEGTSSERAIRKDIRLKRTQLGVIASDGFDPFKNSSGNISDREYLEGLTSAQLRAKGKRNAMPYWATSPKAEIVDWLLDYGKARA